MPPGCEEPAGPDCTGIFSWTLAADGFAFLIEALLDDLRPPPTATTNATSSATYYGAVGFSLDAYMGDDSVLVCVVDASSGLGTLTLGWNDRTHNYLQLQVGARR